MVVYLMLWQSSSAQVPMQLEHPSHISEKPYGTMRKVRIIKKGRKMYFSEIGLLTHHEPKPKKDLLNKLNLQIGENADKLRKSVDLSYYNNGVGKLRYFKAGKEIGYGD